MSDYCRILASGCHGSQTHLSKYCLIVSHHSATSHPLVLYFYHSHLINLALLTYEYPLSLFAWSWHYRAMSDYLPKLTFRYHSQYCTSLTSMILFTHKTTITHNNLHITPSLTQNVISLQGPIVSVLSLPNIVIPSFMLVQDYCLAQSLSYRLLRLLLTLRWDYVRFCCLQIAHLLSCQCPP
jgi:hypothetical protein